MKRVHWFLTFQGLLVMCDVRVKSANISKVDGRWSGWSVSGNGSCLENCLFQVFMYRDCSNPPPYGNGLPCTGSQDFVYLERCPSRKCREGNDSSQTEMVKGSWGKWRLISKQICRATCHRVNTYKRECLGPATGRTACIGTRVLLILDYCDGGSCARVDLGWTSWYPDKVLEECSWKCVQKVRRRRLCMNTPPSGGGNVCPGPLLSVVTMKCTGGRCRTMHGSWSVWERATLGPCWTNCSRSVMLSRRCGLQLMSGCAGEETGLAEEQCGLPDCIDTARDRTKQMEDSTRLTDVAVSGSVMIGFLCVLLGAVLSIYARVKKETNPILVAGQPIGTEYTFQYDNPTFQNDSVAEVGSSKTV